MNLSDAARKRWQNPAYRAKQRAAVARKPGWQERFWAKVDKQFFDPRNGIVTKIQRRKGG